MLQAQLITAVFALHVELDHLGQLLRLCGALQRIADAELPIQVAMDVIAAQRIVVLAELIEDFKSPGLDGAAEYGREHVGGKAEV